MKIKFQISETISQLLREVETSKGYESWYEQGKIYPSEGTWFLKDIDFDSIAKVEIYTNSIHIVTAFSAYEYIISERDGNTLVWYEGAYLGLLAQNLLPTLTPVSILEAEIESSISKAETLREFIQDREAFCSYKEQAGFTIRKHPMIVRKEYSR